MIGVDPSDPLFPGHRDAWVRERAEIIEEERTGSWQGNASEQDVRQAEAELQAELTEEAERVWRARGAPKGTAEGDWLRAVASLDHDRTARFAYLHWRERLELGGDYWGGQVEDWAAAETAARYSDPTVRAARRFFAAWVRPLGPVPALRVGAQPYGILPVLPLERWVPAEGEEPLLPLVRALRGLRDRVWLPASERVPQVGAHRRRSVEETQATLLELLATAPLGQAVYAREHLGRDYVADLWRFAELQLDPGWERTLGLSSAPLLHELGIAWRPRLRDLLAADHPAAVPGPLVGEDPAAYLGWLASTKQRWGALAGRPELGDDPAQTPLLYRLLRQSALREIVAGATRIQLRRGTLGDWEHLDSELVGVRLQQPVTPRDQLARTIRVGKLPITLDEYVAGPTGAGDPDVELGAFRDAVLALARAAPDRLETTLRATLDALSHRLDAWITSLATKRMHEQRAARPEGVALGGFGWVEHLVPRGMQPRSDGFVHAPSIPQAVTAGILRSGYLSHTGGGRNPFAVDLSSERVRVARHVLEGVRNGQTVGAVAGYLFERAIHDAGADEYTDDFRRLAPMHATVVDQGDAPPREVVQPSAVVDGLALRTMWSRGTPEPALQAVLDVVAEAGAAKLRAVSGALGALEDALDGTADLLLLESLHQATSGSPSRAAATLDAMARGDGHVPDPDSVRTPRSGLALTHRIALVVPAGAPTAPGWSAPGRVRARQAAAPALEALAASLLPDPRRVRATVRLETEARAGTVVVRLSDCDLGALDCVYGAPASPDRGHEVPALLRLAVEDEARRRLRVPLETDLRFDWGRGAGWEAADLTFGEMARAARLVRATLRHGRPLRAADLSLPELAAATPDADDPDLATRADAAAATLRAAAAALADPAAAPVGLRRAAWLGVPGAVEALAERSTDPARVDAVAAEAARRLAGLVEVEEAETPPGYANDRHARRIRAVFGEDFLAPHAVTPASGAAFAADLARGDDLLGPGGAYGRRWLQRVSRVRPAAGALERLRLAGRAVGLAAPPRLRVLQLPRVEGEPWIGEAARVSGPRVGLALLTPPGGALRGPLAGVVLDEWVEVVPRTVETTGIAIHYDTPGAAAPQAILLAVAPDPAAATWTDSMLEDALADALRLARVRAADPEVLERVGQLLPALYLPYNEAGDTASTDAIPV